MLVEFYIGQEERELLEHLDAVVREEAERRWLPDEEEGDVTGSGLRVLQVGREGVEEGLVYGMFWCTAAIGVAWVAV